MKIIINLPHITNRPDIEVTGTDASTFDFSVGKIQVGRPLSEYREYAPTNEFTLNIHGFVDVIDIQDEKR